MKERGSQNNKPKSTDETVYNACRTPSLFLPYLEMHGVRMIDYACNGGESLGGRDNNMHKFNRHIQKWQK